jgi:hypothetical protein
MDFIWSSLGWGILITSIVTTAIDQSYQDFGIRICDRITQEVREQCIDAMREERDFNSLAILTMILSTSAVASFQPRKQDK